MRCNPVFRSPKEDECGRRTNIIWCSPPEEATDTEAMTEGRAGQSEAPKSEGGNDNNNLKPPNVEDDGFESLNGNGSSENGDENQDSVNCRAIRGGDRTTDGRSHFKRINFLIDDNVTNLPNRSEEENFSTYEESLGAVKKCNDCSVTELFKMDKCYESQCRVNENSEEIDCDDVSWVENLGDKKCPVVCRRRSGK